MDVAYSYEQYQRQQAEARQTGKPAPVSLSREQMNTMLERVKNDSKASKR